MQTNFLKISPQLFNMGGYMFAHVLHYEYVGHVFDGLLGKIVILHLCVAHIKVPYDI
jgi:hypothetical protein